MASLNKVQIIGNLGADPETRYTPGGDAVTNIRVATTEKWKDKASGEMKERTEWWTVVFWGRLAEVAGEYLKKGSPVYVEGKGQTEKWQDKEGVDRYSFKVRADHMVLLGSKPDGGREHSGDDTGQRRPPREPDPKGGASAQQKKPAGKFDDMEDDIPF